ncbi:MAG: transposase zinc-binding domain-containing protein [Kiritimatiellae bacterium]|nr:transposase zinc-binding domain-containing protein [Kiritimatiellia bacterium]
MPRRLAQAARRIMDCRTSALGGRLHRCDARGAEVPLYNSCRDRHCPTCQTLRKQRWLEQPLADGTASPKRVLAASAQTGSPVQSP